MCNKFLTVRTLSGKDIHLIGIHVLFTYSGLIEGKIVPEVNSFILDSPRIAVEAVCPGLPFFIANEELIKKQAQSILPQLRFIGEFVVNEVDPVTRERPFSFAVIWYQNDLQPLISPENLEGLKAINIPELLNQRSTCKRKHFHSKWSSFLDLFKGDRPRMQYVIETQKHSENGEK